MSAEEKSEDKKEIEDEEREKILNETEEKKGDDVQPEGEVQKMKKALEECELDRDVKKKVPIGGIKIPGFLKSKSRDKCKDGEQDVEEGKDLLQDSVPVVTVTQDKERAASDEKSGSGGRKTLLATIMINNPFGKRNKDKDPGGTAGLASMETLEDSSGVDKAADQVDDGMESVKLDSDDKLDAVKGEETDNVQKPFWAGHFDIRNKFHVIICAAVLFLVLLVVVIAVAASGRQETWPTPIDSSPFVTAITTCGLVQGHAEGGAYVFRGVPYAAPPVAERRFRPAQPLNDIKYCWNGTRPQQASSEQCLQVLEGGLLAGSEDCLTLDVWTPRVSFENPVPVVVLVAAETLARGYSPPLEPAAQLARSKDVVLVRVNFRLGVLGFLSADSLDHMVHPPTSGNYALSDLLVALEWLHTNIQAFNGNNNSVTVVGHGAGATLVTVLCAHGRARRLFSRAWLASGSGALPQTGEVTSTEAYERYLRSLPCGQEQLADCLARLEARTLLEMVPPGWTRPFSRLGEPQHSWLLLDRVYLKDDFQETWATPDNIPVVVGAAVHSDVPSTEGHSPEAWDEADGRLVRERLSSGPLAPWMDEVVRRYGATWRGYVSLVSDLRTVCPLAVLARLRPGTTFYLVNHTRDGLADARSDLDAALGRYQPHGSPEDRRFSAALQEMLYSFAKSGDVPLGRGKSHGTVVFVDQHAATHHDHPHCGYWAAKDVLGKFARRD